MKLTIPVAKPTNETLQQAKYNPYRHSTGAMDIGNHHHRSDKAYVEKWAGKSVDSSFTAGIEALTEFVAELGHHEIRFEKNELHSVELHSVAIISATEQAVLRMRE